MGTFVLMPVLLGSGLALIYHRGVDIGALSVGSYGQILTAKILLAFLSFELGQRSTVSSPSGGRVGPSVSSG
jgi:hypothetical protein